MQCVYKVWNKFIISEYENIFIKYLDMPIGIINSEYFLKFF